MNTDIYAAVAEAMAAIDPAEAIAQLGENEASRAEVAEAIEAGQQELAALAEQMLANSRRGPDIDAAAQALIDGEDVVTAAATRKSLEERREAIGEGLKGLRQRAEGLDASRREIRRRLAERFIAAGDLLYPSMIGEAHDLARRLSQLYANVMTAAAATGSGKLTYLAQRLETPLAHLAQAHVNEEVLIDGNPLRSDPELANALDVGSDALRIARRAVPESVSFPQPEHDGATFNAGFAAGRAAAG